MKKNCTVALLLAVVVFVSAKIALGCGFEEYREIKYTREMVQAMNAAFTARTELGIEKGDEKMLVLTNASYGTVNGNTTEAFLDIVSNVTACSMGTRSLLMVHTPYTQPLWCAFYRKDTGKVVFIKWKENKFQQQVINVSPDKILTSKAWKAAASGLIGTWSLFSVVTISNSWSSGASWHLLKNAEFHNHICPGLNAGYVMAEHLKRNYPLRRAEQYVFVGAPPSCANDALQVMYDATVGKNGIFAKSVGKEKLKKYAGDLWFEGMPLSPILAIAMRVSKNSNSCEGVVIGFDWKSLFRDTGVNHRDFAPPGGKSNPAYFVSRATASIKLASMNMDDKLKYVRDIKKFFGQAAIAQKITSEGTEPYAVIWSMQ
ncbi:MAG: FmdE family protein [Deltaproteobacteria bacterium]|jgi:formylmethanofuran dehydrogenase subunit E-like metal-binding protein|nr:FmdE family protein [Deltaproteobacteria bacterium]